MLKSVIKILYRRDAFYTKPASKTHKERYMKNKLDKFI